MRASISTSISALATLAITMSAAAQQQGPDTTWVPNVARPAYAAGTGPRVGIDEAHHNFHTVAGRYSPFAALLRRDGYRVSPSTQPFTRESLAAFDVLVIANASGGSTPETMSNAAFTEGERAALREWVRGGGSLLLIADHAPFGAAAEALGQEFGVGMSKGFTLDTTPGTSDGNPSFLLYTRDNGLLGTHPILEGRGADERVSVVRTFTGQSLSIPPGATALLRLSPTARDRAAPTPGQNLDLQGPGNFTPAAGRAQGAALPFGAGRVVVLGEAGMFSAQVINLPGREPMRMGMNVPGSDDQQFALNVLHWLSRLF